MVDSDSTHNKLGTVREQTRVDRCPLVQTADLPRGIADAFLKISCERATGHARPVCINLTVWSPMGYSGVLGQLDYRYNTTKFTIPVSSDVSTV